MLGSSNSIACANIMLNAAVAESLKIYADRLEGADDFESALHDMIKKTIKDHKRIIFNGNGYDDAWITEATEERGLCNYRTTADAVPHLLDKKNMDMLIAHGVFTEAELRSRYEITLENYCKTVIIEANTMVDMAKKQILPAISAYVSDLAEAVGKKLALGTDIACSYEKETVKKLSLLSDKIAEATEVLEGALIMIKSKEDIGAESVAIRDSVLPAMSQLRVACDEAETSVAEKYWPFPTYGELLFGVR